METLNMMSIPVDQFCREIANDLDDGNYDPVVGIGLSGVGKTMSIYELTQKRKIGFCEMRLVTMGEIDILGIPTTKNGRTTYAPNSLLPDADRDGEEGILVLDEITSATSPVRAAAYQLLDSKRALGEYKLPPKWKVVALGNGPDDGGVFQGMEAAFLSRCTCYRVSTNLETWKKWAIANGVNSSVVAFLQWQPDNLHKLNPDEIASVFPCPRSWTALSKRLNAREAKNGGPLELDAVEIYAAGAVGVKVAPQFATFYAHNKDTVDINGIIEGRVKAQGSGISKKKPEVIYLTLQGLIKKLGEIITEKDVDPKTYHIRDIEKTKKLVNAVRFILDLGATRSDYANTAIQDLGKISQIYYAMCIDTTPNTCFAAMCPEFDEYLDAHIHS